MRKQKPAGWQPVASEATIGLGHCHPRGLQYHGDEGGGRLWILQGSGVQSVGCQVPPQHMGWLVLRAAWPPAPSERLRLQSGLLAIPGTLSTLRPWVAS